MRDTLDTAHVKTATVLLTSNPKPHLLCHEVGMLLLHRQPPQRRLAGALRGRQPPQGLRPGGARRRRRAVRIRLCRLRLR